MLVGAVEEVHEYRDDGGLLQGVQELWIDGHVPHDLEEKGGRTEGRLRREVEKE